MIGAIAGDIIGSIYEAHPIKTTDFPLFQPASTFTDDTILTVAIAHAILTHSPYDQALRSFGLAFPNAGYGASFFKWLLAENPKPYNSWGNGSAMRVSPVGFAFDNEQEVLIEAENTAKPTHNHPEGIKGAQAVALAVFLARTGHAKQTIQTRISKLFGYDLTPTIADIRPHYRPDLSCQGSVPQALIAFLESSSFENAVRNAVSLGGDSDTLACIAGAVAYAYYKRLPDHIVTEVRARLPLALLQVLDQFKDKFGW